MALLRAEGIGKAYLTGRQTVAALHDVDLDIEAGEFLAIMGPSGCGKTTMLNCLSGLDTVDEGRILFEDQDLAKLSDRRRTRLRGERIGFVFQAFHLIPVLTALQNVRLPLELAGMRRGAAEQRAREALQAVAIADQAAKRPSEMSGGQQQRVAIARALAPGPAVVFADEPTGNLDSSTGRDVLQLFQALNQDSGVTFVLVTHDPKVAAGARRVVQMDSGAIVSDTGGRGVAVPRRAASKR